jgi:hypothetical protein
MEVHHHSHHPKKWKEYITEFLMLFLAVSLGFLAENLRENFVEKEREHELAKSLYNELKADSTDLAKIIAFRLKKENYLNYLYENYKGDIEQDSIQKTYQVALYIGVNANSSIIFEPRNAIIHQLESSGMMRYFKEPELQADLHDIINAAEKVKMRTQREIDLYMQFVLPQYIQYQDLDLTRILTQKGHSKESLNEVFENYLASKDYYKTPKRTLSPDLFNKMIRSFEFYRFVLSSTRGNQLANYHKASAKLLQDLRAIYKFN